MTDDNLSNPHHITPPPPLTPLGDLVSPPKTFVDAATAARRAASVSRAPAPAPAAPKDAVRDIVETIVFVVVLVLLLKTFIAEAFVIPTGSMATTLWGYQKVVECPKCKETFPVNCSSEVDPQAGPPVAVLGCVCPNCRYVIDFEKEHLENPNWKVPTWNSGDRVLVSKFLYDCQLRNPERQDVVVFKFPGGSDFPTSGPQKNHVAMNYIKRLVGKPSETIGIYYGNLYVAEGLHAPTTEDDLGTPFGLRTRKYMHEDDDVELLIQDAVKSNKGKDGQDNRDKRFHMVRKSPDKTLAMSRLVYDNDHQADDLKGKPFQRWAAGSDKEESFWKAANSEVPTVFEHAARSGPIAWLRYRHLVPRPGPDRDTPPKPELITDFMGYNSGIPAHASGQSLNWVGDLILNCEVKLDRAPADEDELALELSKGPDRFRARFLLKAGKITLLRATKNDEGGIRESVLETIPTARLRQPGTYKLGFANVNERLTLWVDNELPFGDGKDYDPPRYPGPDREEDPAKNNDLQPASIGVKGAAVTVSHLMLRRDTYYTVQGPRSDADLGPDQWSNPKEWSKLRELPAKTLYIQPAHYLCMGDNSPESSDGREWGTVPERLLLGRALLVYYPFARMGQIK